MENDMEFCDLYDENRNLLGKTHNRADKPALGEYIAVIGVWTFNSKNEILLTKRHPEKKIAPNLWESTGGHLLAGETSKGAAVRELKEETGITVDESELNLIGSVKISPYLDDEYFIKKDIAAGDIVLQEGETVDAKWVTHAEFLRMADTGELAPFVMEYMIHIWDKFEAAFKAINPC